MESTGRLLPLPFMLVLLLALLPPALPELLLEAVRLDFELLPCCRSLWDWWRGWGGGWWSCWPNAEGSWWILGPMLCRPLSWQCTSGDRAVGATVAVGILRGGARGEVMGAGGGG